MESSLHHLMEESALQRAESSQMLNVETEIMSHRWFLQPVAAAQQRCFQAQKGRKNSVWFDFTRKKCRVGRVQVWKQSTAAPAGEKL